MSPVPLSIRSTGLVTSVGLTAPATCAAMRAKVTNPSETSFIGSDGQRIMAHQVELERPWRGLTRLAKMSAMAIEEALADLPTTRWMEMPLLLCVAEPSRPGRLQGLDDELLPMIEAELGVRFDEASRVVAHGRVSVAVALAQARTMIGPAADRQALIAATDSHVTWPSLRAYGAEDRLLTASNSDGFMPGEGAGAVRVGAFAAGDPVVCDGIGFAVETAHIHSGLPLRADGMVTCFRHALADAGRQMHDLDFRIGDVSGEQYYFKEASLALDRVLRTHKFPFPLWHPAETIGETGALSGLACLAAARAAALKGYAEGPGAMLHFSNDDGARAALTLRSLH